MLPTQKVVNALSEHSCHPRRRGRDWSALCPAHDDRKASLSISTGQDGRALVHCHAGCSVEEVCGSLGLQVLDLMPKANSLSAPRKAPVDARSPKIVATYDYHDEKGDLLFQVVRFEPKDFRQRRPKPDGGWDWSVRGVRTVPYRLPDIVERSDKLVVIVEGEKDADKLNEVGILATCNAGGAGKWTAEHAEFLRGRQCCVIPDNDEPGRKHAHQVARMLYGVAERVWLVELPGVPEKGDVSDWFQSGRTPEKLEEIYMNTPPWTPEAAKQPGPIITCLAEVEPCEIEWLWPGRIPKGRISLLVGRPGEGKSFLTTDVAARVSTGSPWPDGAECPQGSVLLLTAEDDPRDTIRPRLDAHQADVKKVHLLSAVRRATEKGVTVRMVDLADLDAIESALNQLPDCQLVVVDPIGSFLGGGTDSHRDSDVRSLLAPIAALAEKYGPAVVVVAHRRKSAGNIADDLALGSRAFTGVARAVWHLCRDRQDPQRRLLLPGKNNLGPEGNGLAFTIAGEPAQVAWEAEPVNMTANDHLAAEHGRQKRGRPADSRSDAVDWLEQALAEGPRLAKELRDEWRDAHAGSMRTLERAKQTLRVDAFRKEVPGPWWWRNSNTAKNANIHQLADSGDVEQDRQNNTATSPQENNYGGLGGLGEKNTTLSLSTTEIRNTAKNANIPQLEDSGGVGDVEKDLLSLLEEDLENAKKESESQREEGDSTLAAKMAKLNESSQGGHLGETDDVTSSNETPHPFGNVPPTPPVRLAPWSPPIPTENPTASS